MESSRRPSAACVCMCVCMCVLTLSNTNISAIKFYLKHHWGGRKAAIGFGPDRIGPVVSMATVSSHRVIMGKILLAL